MRKSVFLLVMASVFLFLASGSALAESKIRVAVLEFTEKNAGRWAGNVGKATEAWFVDELVNAGKFKVLERQQLAGLLQEKGFQKSDNVDPKTAAQAGKMAGVQVVVFGIVEFTQKEQGGQGSSRIPGFGGVFGGATKKTSEGNITGRAVNVETGEILFSKSQTVTSSSLNISVMGVGGGTSWDETVVRKTFQPAIKEIVAEMVARIETMKEGLSAAGSGAEGKIVQIKGDALFFSLGTLDEVQPGEKFDVVRAEVIKDPDSGAVLGRDEQQVGSIVVEKVAGEHLSRAKADSGSGFAVGDIVKKQ